MFSGIASAIYQLCGRLFSAGRSRDGRIESNRIGMGSIPRSLTRIWETNPLYLVIDVNDHELSKMNDGIATSDSTSMFSLSTASGKAHLVAKGYDVSLLISVLTVEGPD